MSISICVPTYNRLPSLTRLLGSCYKGFGDYPYEIIVADGGSTDGTVEYLKTQEKVLLIEQGELTGAVKAFNICFKLAKYEYILFIPDDVIVIPEVIVKACNLMDKHEDIGLVAPKWIEPTYGNMVGTELTFPFLVLSKAHIFRATILKKISYFDENYTTYAIDDDSCLSVLELGYTIIFTKEIGVIHARINDDLRKRNKVNSVEVEYFFRKWEKLNNSLSEILKKSPIKKYKAIMFKHICDRILRHLTKPKPVETGLVTSEWYDRFLEQCAVFKSKEYSQLKGFYLAQRLPLLLKEVQDG